MTKLFKEFTVPRFSGGEHSAKYNGTIIEPKPRPDFVLKILQKVLILKSINEKYEFLEKLCVDSIF